MFFLRNKMMPGFKAFYLDDPQLPEKVKKTVRLPGGKTIYCKPPTISAVKEGRASASYLSL